MSTPVIVVQPVPVTDAMLISTTVAEADYPAWSAGTSYLVGERVIYVATHRVYESLVSGNLGNTPSASPTHWIEVGPTNRWAMFDGSNSTSTVAPSGAMSYTLRQVGGLNALAALNVRGANSIRVRLVHTTLGTVYDRTTSLASLPTDTGWWAWWWGVRTAPPLMVATDLPGIPGCDLVVDFTGTTELSVGVLMWGEARSFGLSVLQGARVGIVDYSRIETDAWGQTVLVQRAYAKRASWTVPIPADQVDAVVEYLSTLRAIPCLWIGSAAYAGTVVYGIYKSLDVTIAYHSMSECQLDLQGLT